MGAGHPANLDGHWGSLQVQHLAPARSGLAALTAAELLAAAAAVLGLACSSVDCPWAPAEKSE